MSKSFNNITAFLVEVKPDFQLILFTNLLYSFISKLYNDFSYLILSLSNSIAFWAAVPYIVHFTAAERD